MPLLPPPVEVLPNSSRHEDYRSSTDTRPAPRAFRRPLIFAGVFLASLAASLAYVWNREPIYRSTASVLTVAPPAVDEVHAEASVQHVAVQRQTLLGVPLLEEALRRLKEQPDMPPAAAELGLDRLQTLLAVEPLPETNVVELRAQGPDPLMLAPAVNAWIDAYQALRERTVRESKDTTTLALREEFERLGRTLTEKRQALDDFRREHGILSRKDTDNQAMARLNGLNNSLNKASETEVDAKAKLDAIQDAIARGEPVVPPSDERGLANLELRAQELRETVAELERRYTPHYIAMQPKFRVIPEQLRQIEDEIRKKLDWGKRAALNEAERAYASAHQSVKDLRAQIEAHKREAAEFTARFAEHEAMQADLQQVETLYRNTESRLVQVEAKPRESYPQLQVVDRAYPPTHPLWPDYWRDSGIALGGSLGTALAFLLLFDYLMRREKPPAPAPLPNIQVYSVPENLLLQRQPRVSAAPALTGDAPPALESPFPRELADLELRQWLEAADLKTRQLLGLLLSGLSLEEAAELRPEQVDLAGHRLRVGGGHPRTVPLAPKLRAWLAETEPAPAWASASPTEPDDLAALLACAAVDAGLAEPHTADAAAVRHSYLVHLVRQGVRLTDLEGIVGRLPAKTAAAYGRYAPPGPKLRADAVPRVHPVLLDGNPTAG
jgi:succinoglycan biosynthesis transport protein ExoP